MKRFILLSIFALATFGVYAQIEGTSIQVNGDLSEYKYYYVTQMSVSTFSTPISGSAGGIVTYGFSGGETRTIAPTELIAGHLMKSGYNTISLLNPEFANQTLIISMGYTGRRHVRKDIHASGIIIQMRNAQTQDLIVSISAEALGEEESEEIVQAIDHALTMFDYYVHPSVDVEIISKSKLSVGLQITNKTPKKINQIVLRLYYYLNGELQYEQTYTGDFNIPTNGQSKKYITRGEQVLDKKYMIKAEILSYQ